MAIKPITNKQVVSKTNINRGQQKSTKDITARNLSRGNSAQSINPGNNLSNNYSVTLKDIDSSILSHVKNVMRPSIKESNERINIPVMYGNEERWKSVRKRGVMRDTQNALILPLVMLKRTNIEKNANLVQGFEHDVMGNHVNVVRNSGWSKNNRYDRFSVQTGKKPVYEQLVTGMPDFVSVTYEFVVWTNFIEQMNTVIESFVEQNNKYWGTSTEYKFLCSIDSIQDASEMNQDGERFIKSTFNVLTNAYILTEYTNSTVTDMVSQLKKKITPSKVVFGFEGDASNKQVGN